MLGLLATASLFLTNPAPLEMPRAQAYFAHEGGRAWLEDRYNELDLWTSRTVDGRWIDDDGRVFVLATLAARPPIIIAHAPPVTRVEYVDRSIPIGKGDLDGIREAAAMIAPVELAEKESPPDQMPRWYDDVDYWQGTNTSAIVCTFRVKDSDVWRLATWSLVKGDDFDEAVKKFEDEFLVKEYLPFLEEFEGRNTNSFPIVRLSSPEAEKHILRDDARHSVAGYEDWHVTDAQTFVILDDLRGREARKFIVALTNELADLYVAATNALPSPLETSNTLCVARIYADRFEYLDALGVGDKTNMAWSAAYWCPCRRELVAHLSGSGGDELIKTIRHEAFHQYLSYATAMYATSLWLNEGYAQYLENTNSLDWALGSAPPTPYQLKKLSEAIPDLLKLGYQHFYDDETVLPRHLKYRLAWSIAVFIEKGARDVRFDPFKNLKRDYFAALLKTHDALQATDAAFVSEDKIRLFASEWLKWWKKRLDES